MNLPAMRFPRQETLMREHYTATAKSLHWLTALMLFGLLAMGLFMKDLPLSPEKLQLYSWHKWAGVTVFLLTLARIGWRIQHPPPPLPLSMGRGAQAAAHAGHLLLYALMIAIPLSGWLMSSAKGFQTVWFGIIPLPDLVGKDKALGESLGLIHQWLNFTLMAAVLLHIAAAIKHRVIDKDDVLARMSFARKP